MSLTSTTNVDDEWIKSSRFEQVVPIGGTLNQWTDAIDLNSQSRHSDAKYSDHEPTVGTIDGIQRTERIRTHDNPGRYAQGLDLFKIGAHPIPDDTPTANPGGLSIATKDMRAMCSQLKTSIPFPTDLNHETWCKWLKDTLIALGHRDKLGTACVIIGRSAGLGELYPKTDDIPVNGGATHQAHHREPELTDAMSKATAVALKHFDDNPARFIIEQLLLNRHQHCSVVSTDDNGWTVLYQNARVLEVQIMKDGEIYVNVEVKIIHTQSFENWWVPYTDVLFRGNYDALNRTGNLVDTLRTTAGIVPTTKSKSSDTSLSDHYSTIRTMLIEILADQAAASWVVTAIGQTSPSQLLATLTETIPSRLVPNLYAHRRNKHFQWITGGPTTLYFDIHQIPKTLRELREHVYDLIDKGITLGDVLHAIVTQHLRNAKPEYSDVVYLTAISDVLRAAENPPKDFPITLMGSLEFWEKQLTRIRHSEPTDTVGDDDTVPIPQASKALAVATGGKGGKGAGKGNKDDKSKHKAEKSKGGSKQELENKTCVDCKNSFKPGKTHHKRCATCQTVKVKANKDDKKDTPGGGDSTPSTPKRGKNVNQAIRASDDGAASSSRGAKRIKHALVVLAANSTTTPREEVRQIFNVAKSYMSASQLESLQAISGEIEFEVKSDTYGDLHVVNASNPNEVSVHCSKDAKDKFAPRVLWCSGETAESCIKVESQEAYKRRCGKSPKCNLKAYEGKVRRAYNTLQAELKRNPDGPVAGESKAWFDTFNFDDSCVNAHSFDEQLIGLLSVATYMCSDTDYGEAIRKYISQTKKVRQSKKLMKIIIRVLCDSCCSVSLIPYSMLSEEQASQIDYTRPLSLIRAGNDHFKSMGPIPEFEFSCECDDGWSALKLINPHIVDDRASTVEIDTQIILIPAGPMCTASMANRYSSKHPTTPSVMVLDDRVGGQGCFLQRPNGKKLKLYMDTDGMPAFRLNPNSRFGAAQLAQLDADDGSDDSNGPPKRKKSSVKPGSSKTSRV